MHKSTACLDVCAHMYKWDTDRFVGLILRRWDTTVRTDTLTHTHPLLLWQAYLALVATRVSCGTLGSGVQLAGAGVTTWICTFLKT